MTARIIPTQGGYQNPKPATFVRETPAQYVVKVEGVEQRFWKGSMMGVGYWGRQFPQYKLELTP